MPPALAIADDLDGTGATATVSGATGTVNVFAGRVLGEVGEIALPQIATRSGNGTLALDTGRGYFFAYAEDSLARSPLYYFAATSGLDAVAKRLRNALESRFRLVAMPEYPELTRPLGEIRVYQQIHPDEGNVTFPCLMLSIEGVQETPESSQSLKDDWGRPCRVAIFDRHDTHAHSGLSKYELWRERLIRSVNQQRVPGLPESLITKVEPYVIADPNLPAYQHFVSGFLVRATCREPRGLGA
jgi:hypothetical protein